MNLIILTSKAKIDFRKCYSYLVHSWFYPSHIYFIHHQWFNPSSKLDWVSDRRIPQPVECLGNLLRHANNSVPSQEELIKYFKNICLKVKKLFVPIWHLRVQNFPLQSVKFIWLPINNDNHDFVNKLQEMMLALYRWAQSDITLLFAHFKRG